MAMNKACHWLPNLWEYLVREFRTQGVFQADCNQKAIDWFKEKVSSVISKIEHDSDNGLYLVEGRKDVVVCFGLTDGTAKMKPSDLLDTLAHNTAKVLVVNGKLIKKDPKWWLKEITRRGLVDRPDLAARCRGMIPDYHPELRNNLLVFVTPDFTA